MKIINFILFIHVRFWLDDSFYVYFFMKWMKKKFSFQLNNVVNINKPGEATQLKIKFQFNRILRRPQCKLIA